MIIENLYERIIRTNFKNSIKIYILSGYGSGAFLKEVIAEFPKLQMDIYLGMTHEGVSKCSHEIFQEITQNNEDINVYYQIKGAPNHMKIYSVFSEQSQSKSFVGSANFTENGFYKNKEILLESDIDFSGVFKAQHESSLICTDSEIEEFVSIYEDKAFDLPNTSVEKGKVKSDSKEFERFNHKLSKLITMKNSANGRFYKEFQMEVVKSNDPNWELNGINSAIYGGEPHIKLETRVFLDKVFPSEVELTIIMEDNNEFKVRSEPMQRNSLYFIDVNIYNYFKNKLGLTENRPISARDLESIESNQMHFIRLDEFKYYMEFN